MPPFLPPYALLVCMKVQGLYCGPRKGVDEGESVESETIPPLLSA